MNNSYKKIATLVGVLYIIGTVAGILSLVVTHPVLGVPNFVTAIAASPNRLVLGSLFILLMGVALAFIPLAMFPIFKQTHEAGALGYIVFRSGLETTTYMVTVLSWLVLIRLSHLSAEVGPGFDAQATGELVLAVREMSTYLVVFAFSTGALIFYSLLFQTKLVPRWLSGWGLIAISLHIIAGGLSIFAVIAEFLTLHNIMNLPIFVQEMVLAVWLIVRGFNPTVTSSASTTRISLRAVET